MKAIVLVSGGLDSAVLLSSIQQEASTIRALSFDYGQRHGGQELSRARLITAAAQVEHRIVDVSGIRLLFNSSQTSDKVPVPEGHYTAESMKATVVASRNLVFLSIAIGWGQTLRFDTVAYAAHGGDHTIYPDCRPEFVGAVDAVARLSDWHSVMVIAPFVHKTKADIVRLGVSLNVDLGRTWSCYKGLTLHCGKCGTCVERREAFVLAEVSDPTLYAE